MKMFSTLAVLSATLVFVSCKKDKSTNLSTQSNSNPSPQTSRSYMPLKTGAYWLYKRGTMDTLENISFSGSAYDSVYVSGDTVINGAKHFILKHTLTGYSYFGFHGLVSQCYLDSLSQYVMPYYFTGDQIGDTLDTETDYPWLPGLMVYSMPNYYYNMQTALGVKNGIRIESHPVYPSGYPDYYNRYFCYDAYLEGVGMNRKVIMFSSGPDSRMVYELIGYGGLN